MKALVPLVAEKKHLLVVQGPTGSREQLLLVAPSGLL